MRQKWRKSTLMPEGNCAYYSHVEGPMCSKKESSREGIAGRRASVFCLSGDKVERRKSGRKVTTKTRTSIGGAQENSPEQF
jgi:hypothetical protein